MYLIIQACLSRLFNVNINLKLMHIREKYKNHINLLDYLDVIYCTNFCFNKCIVRLPTVSTVLDVNNME